MMMSLLVKTCIRKFIKADYAHSAIVENLVIFNASYTTYCLAIIANTMHPILSVSLLLRLSPPLNKNNITISRQHFHATALFSSIVPTGKIVESNRPTAGWSAQSPPTIPFSWLSVRTSSPTKLSAYKKSVVCRLSDKKRIIFY